jgi:hypothetical protein
MAHLMILAQLNHEDVERVTSECSGRHIRHAVRHDADGRLHAHALFISNEV